MALFGCLGGDDGPCPPPPIVCDLPPGQEFLACNGCNEVWLCSRGRWYDESADWLYTGFECDCLTPEGGIDSDACPVTY